MALTNFVPDIWSRVLNINLRRNLVGQALANTRYQGEIKRAQAASYNEIAPDLVPESEFMRVRDGLEDDESLDTFKTGL